MPADQDVLNSGNGGDNSGAYPYALAAMLYDANLFGLAKDYARPESANTSASRWDQITTLAKLLTRKHTHIDGNSYDMFDAINTILKSVLVANPHINDDEPNSTNFKAAP